MPRISLDLPRTPFNRLGEWYSRRMYGEVLDPGKALAHNRRVLLSYVRYERSLARWKALDPQLKALGVMAAATSIGCSWCLDFGYWESTQRGIDPDKLRNIPRWRDADVYTDVERRVMAYAEAMTANPLEVTDEMVADLERDLGSAALVELTMMVAVENSRSRFNSARTDEPRVQGPLRRPGHYVVIDEFERHRRLLFSVAYDMLGSVADAEDAVQDAWLRWSAADRSDVADPRAYLVRVISRLALDRLTEVRRRRETYVGPWLLEPLLTGLSGAVAVTQHPPDPADVAEQSDAISLAMLVVLETLSPAERAVFVLREVFGMPYGEVAEALDRSESAVRQLAHRAPRARRSATPALPIGSARPT